MNKTNSAGFYPRSVFMLALSIAWMIGLDSVAKAQTPTTPARPNVVWIMSEDNSAEYLRHFDASGAPAPHIEALAKHGITFDRAFSNAPVCSVARTTLITSCYGPRIGTQFHRRSHLAAMPESVRMFPAYLREAGYYTTNHSKEDYNAADRDADTVWSDSSNRASWKNRPAKTTPFFHVETTGVSHESRLHFPESHVQSKPTTTDPDSIKLQPYFPDTPLFRYTRARYHDRMMEVDEHVGKIVADLKQAGELENTFIFYFGDHGGVLPRSKGYVYESGLRVPLVVRVPEQFKSATSRSLGDRTNGFVEFVDFGPTVLSLAGIPTPANVDGKPFMGT
ncbi:MAG: sulfatase, partial [Rubripirellula sp.]